MISCHFFLHSINYTTIVTIIILYYYTKCSLLAVFYITLDFTWLLTCPTTITARLSHLVFSWWFSVSDGRQEAVSFDKITFRVQKLCYGLNSEFVDPVSTVYSCILRTQVISVLVFVSLFLCFCQAQITMKVIQGLYSGVTTVELDTLAAETAATLTTKYPDYAILAARIAVSNLHKETKKVFSGETGFIELWKIYW